MSSDLLTPDAFRDESDVPNQLVEALRNSNTQLRDMEEELRTALYIVLLEEMQTNRDNLGILMQHYKGDFSLEQIAKQHGIEGRPKENGGFQTGGEEVEMMCLCCQEQILRLAEKLLIPSKS